MPFLSIRNVKTIMAGDPIRIQLRHIFNLSGIDKQILELLVDRNHADQIKNWIGKHCDYYVKSDFDPLSADSFDWEGQISEDSIDRLLNRNFAMRLAASIGSTQVESTRQCILTWAKNRCICQQLQNQLLKEGIVISPSIGDRTTIFASDNSSRAGSTAYTRSTTHLSTPGTSKFLKRKLSISSNESLQRYLLLFLLPQISNINH